MSTLSETTCALRIHGDDLDPDEITRVLGRQPDKSGRLGDRRIFPSGRFRVWRTGAWHLECDFERRGNLDKQIQSFLADLPDDLEMWRDLSDRFEIDLFCGLFLAETNEELSISPETITLMAERGIAFVFDIYAPTDG